MHQSPPATTPRFEDITETTGVPLSPEGAQMLYTRYSVATALAHGKRVLELGCAAGQGLGLLARSARSVIGGDYSAPLLRSARAHYDGRFPLVRLTAGDLPFRTSSFDLVLCFETSYYLRDVPAAVSEITRVLSTGGAVLFVNANPERPDFIRSPHSVRYHTADELGGMLRAHGLTVAAHGAFPVHSGAGIGARVAARLLLWARRLLALLNLVPRTLRGRAALKSLLYGTLRTVPAELPPRFAPEAPLVPLLPGPAPGFKVIYVQGERSSG
ncbi:MAG: class I SAM-dependent methyltransferase [Gemmatimonadetes bacterium]|nr:class I SAM-dependent methyltransferase [Gemmatimonadota bacterium]